MSTDDINPYEAPRLPDELAPLKADINWKEWRKTIAFIAAAVGASVAALFL